MFKLRPIDGGNNLCGKRIEQLRLERGLSQRKMAAKLQLMGYDVDNHFIRRIENGERFVTDVELLMFSKFFNVPVSYLISSK